MPTTPPVPDRLACALPDVLKWLEIRAMLLSGRCEILGLEEEDPSRVSWPARSKRSRKASA
jgi:hypothetical protein